MNLQYILCIRILAYHTNLFLDIKYHVLLQLSSSLGWDTIFGSSVIEDYDNPYYKRDHTIDYKDDTHQNYEGTYCKNIKKKDSEDQP